MGEVGGGGGSPFLPSSHLSGVCVSSTCFVPYQHPFFDLMLFLFPLFLSLLSLFLFVTNLSSPPSLFFFSLPPHFVLLERTFGPCNWCFQLQGKWACLQDGWTWPIAWLPVAMVTPRQESWLSSRGSMKGFDEGERLALLFTNPEGPTPLPGAPMEGYCL